MRERKITASDLHKALDSLKMLKYFPSDVGAHTAIMEMLARMCPHFEALDWLVQKTLVTVNDWPGPMEMRGILCTRYRPADGVERDCGIPGLRPCDFEARAIAEAEDDLKRLPAKPVNLRQIAGGKF